MLTGKRARSLRTLAQQNSGPGQEQEGQGGKHLSHSPLFGAKWCFDNGRGAMEQGMQEASRNCKKQGNQFFSRPLKQGWIADTLTLVLVNPRTGLQYLTVKEV